MEESAEFPKTTTQTNLITILGANNIQLLRAYFESNGLYTGCKNALKCDSEIMIKADDIMGRDRGSVVDDEA